MKDLGKILKKNGFHLIKLKETGTNHLWFKAKINGVLGRFILDTGASNTCIDDSITDNFSLVIKGSHIKATGAGSNDLATKISKKNRIQIKTWKWNHLNLVVLDLKHVNQALTEHGFKPIDGIIGADLLTKGNAIIDYRTKNLFLR